MSARYAAKISKRQSRVFEREVHAFAKAVYIAMKEDELDPLTSKTFSIKQRRGGYKGSLMLNLIKDGENQTGKVIAELNLEIEKLFAKGRIRLHKKQLLDVLKKPKEEWKELVGATWLSNLDEISLTDGFKQLQSK